MSLSKGKQERMARQKRISHVQRIYPRYPFGILDYNVEDALRQYIEHANTTHRYTPMQLRIRGGAS